MAYHAFNPASDTGHFGPAGCREGRWRRQGSRVAVSLAGSEGYVHRDITLEAVCTPFVTGWIKRVIFSLPKSWRASIFRLVSLILAKLYVLYKR